MNVKTYITAAVAIASAVIIATPAHATTCKNGAKDYPTCTAPKPPTQPVTPAPAPGYIGGSPVSTSTAAGGQSAAGAVSGAQSGANSSSGANVGNTSAAGGQGGSGGGGGNASSTSASGDSGSTLNSTTEGSRSWALGLSFTPATLPPMAAVQCPSAQIRQETPYGTIIGAIGRGSSSTDTSDCTLIGMYNSMVERCLFASAKAVQDQLVVKYLPNYKPDGVTYGKDSLDPGFVDFSPAMCAAMRKPPEPKPIAQVPAQQPQPPAPAPVPRTVSLEADALFDTDKADLKPAGRAKLDLLAATLRGEAANVIIVGHTDSTGSDAHNDRLSMQRANAVRAHLALAGIDMGRMVALGKGKREPVADNGTAEGRQLNRRVDVQITVPQASKRLERLVAGT